MTRKRSCSIRRATLTKAMFKLICFISVCTIGGGLPKTAALISWTDMSRHLSAFVKLVEAASGERSNVVSSCLETVPAVIARDAEQRASRLICSRSSTLLRTMKAILDGGCSKSEVDRDLDGSGLKHSDASSAVSSQLTDQDQVLHSEARGIERIFESCCGDSDQTARGSRSGASASLSPGALQCLAKASFTGILRLASIRFQSCNSNNRSTFLKHNHSAAFHQMLGNVGNYKILSNLLDHLNADIAEIKRSALRLNELQDLISESENFSWPEVPGVTFVLCNFLTAVSAKVVRPPVCAHLCLPSQQRLRSLEHLINVSQVPFLDVLKSATGLCHSSDAKQCIVQADNAKSGYEIQSINASSNISVRNYGGFCLTVGCQYPMVTTKERNHWLGYDQRFLRGLYADVERLFGKASLPFNGSIWPCAHGCGGLGFTKEEERSIRIMMGAYGIIVVLVVICALVVVYFNRKELTRLYIYRTLLYYSVARGLEYITFTVYFAGYEQNICYDDGTLVMSQPGDKPACGFLGWFVHFFTLISTGYFTVLTYAWQQVGRLIHKPEFSRMIQSGDQWWIIYRQDLVSAVMVVLPAVGMTVAASVEARYTGNPALGTCLLGVQDGGVIYFYALYEVILMIPTLYFLSQGIHHFLKQRRRMTELVSTSQLQEDKHGKRYRRRLTSLSNEHTQASLDNLKRFIRRLVYFMLVVFVSILTHIWISFYILARKDAWSERSRRHRICHQTNCKTSACPAAVDVTTIESMLYIMVPTITVVSVLVMSSWMLTRHLLGNVPCYARVEQMRKSMQSCTLSNTSNNHDNARNGRQIWRCTTV